VEWMARTKSARRARVISFMGVFRMMI